MLTAFFVGKQRFSCDEKFKKFATGSGDNPEPVRIDIE
jgi:hypothetical protein